jgi:hypothetical protein
MAKSGMTCQVKAAGTAVPFVGEAAASGDDTTYQITDTAKRALDRTATIRVHVFTANHVAEAGTNTTNIHHDSHGLVDNDLIVNVTRSNAARLITRVDADNFTVTAVAAQTDGDSIAFYPTEADANTTKKRLEGKVTFGSALARTVRISSSYVPLTAAAEAHQYSYTLSALNKTKTDFGQAHNYQTRIQLLKDITGSLTEWGTTDTTFHAALLAGLPIVLEFWSDTGGTYDVKCWALLNQKAMAGVCDGVLDEVVDFEGSRDADGNVVAFG